MPKRSRLPSRQPSPEPVVSDSGLTGYVLVAGSNDCGQLGIVGFGKRAKPGAPAVKLPPADDAAAADLDLSDEARKILQQQPLFTQAWWSTRAVRQVAAGAIHSVCLLRGNLNNTSFTSNCAITFGAAEDGQCGTISALTGRNDADGKSESTTAKLDPDDIPDFFPTLLNGLPADTIQIAAGDAFTAALTDTGGHVYVTGTLRSTQGKFASFDGMTRVTGRRNLRRKAAAASTAATPSARGEAPHVRITKIVAGSSHLAVLDENDNVYTMGRFQEGQLGRIIGAKKSDSHMENWALQLEQVVVARTAGQLRHARTEHSQDANGGGDAKPRTRTRTKLDKITARFSDVWATPLGLFLRDAEIDAVYACGSNSAGQLGLPLKWNVTTTTHAVANEADGNAEKRGKKHQQQHQQQQQTVKQLVGYFRDRKVVRFRQKTTGTAAAATIPTQNVTAETVDNNLLDLDITVEFPEHVPGLDGLDIIQIVGSEVHTLALSRTGDVYVFGSNKFYALGLSQSQLSRTFLHAINENRLTTADDVSDSDADGDTYVENLTEDDEIIQERLRDPIFVPVTRLLPAAITPAAIPAPAPVAAEPDAGDGKRKRRKIVATSAPVVAVAPEEPAGGNIALKEGEPVESIAAGSRQSYFITRKAGRLYRCGDNNNKLMFVRVLDDLEDDEDKYVKNVDYITRGSDNVQDVALLRPLLYESEVLNSTNRVLSVAVGGQHALLLAQRNQ